MLSVLSAALMYVIVQQIPALCLLGHCWSMGSPLVCFSCVLYVTTVYVRHYVYNREDLQGTYRVDALQCCLVRVNNGGSKDKGEGGWVKHGSHRDQIGIIVDDSDVNDKRIHQKPLSPLLPPPPQKNASLSCP